MNMNIDHEQRAVVQAWAEYARVAESEHEPAELQAALDKYIEAVSKRDESAAKQWGAP